jgi:23S rRNA (uracil1939-C5)-methyltransferase
MEIRLRITDLSRSGPGLGRDASGRVVFVPFTAPGDEVRVEIVSEEKRYAEGRVLEFLEKSPSRANPPCPVFGRCGGCQWQHLPYELQWSTKKGGVLHSLARVGVEAKHVPLEEFPAERIWEYRNRVQLRGFQDQLGFYARGSKQLVAIEKCYIARPELNERIPAAREAGRARPREYKLELEVFPDGKVSEAWNAGHSAMGFRQVHDEQNEKLRAWVASHLSEGGTLLDLYGGSGNLSLGIAHRFEEAHCVDVGAPAQAPDGIPSHFHFHRQAVLPWLQQNGALLAKAPRPLRLVLDPPREGLGNELVPILEILAALPVEETLLVGCEPDQWARATSRFLRRGWNLERLGALDFFPQTTHVEALAVLRKDSRQ